MSPPSRRCWRCSRHARDLALLAFVTALAAGGSDTVASEIGKAWGTAHLSRVDASAACPPGTSGAMSLEGTAAGIVGALRACRPRASRVGLVPRTALLPSSLGATIGSLVESLLGATLEAPGILNNDVLNFMNTAIAAGAAIARRGVACMTRQTRAGALLFEFSRPFTLVAPALGFASGAATAAGAAPREAWSTDLLALSR